MAATVRPKDSLFAAMVKKESGFFSFGKRGRRQKKKERGREKERCESRTRLPKNLELFLTNRALYISLSSIQVFNLKSAH